jgi:hypothetical protein
MKSTYTTGANMEKNGYKMISKDRNANVKSISLSFEKQNIKHEKLKKVHIIDFDKSDGIESTSKWRCFIFFV